MSGRGRGGYQGRGGYGGRGGFRGPYRGGGRGSSRGSYEGRGGRGGYSSSYSHENRYNTGNGDRYMSSRDRIDDSYKKSYRSESSSYGSRDYGRSGSPDRKRMRMEGGSGDRRSHDTGGHFGSSYIRPDSYVSERRSFGEERRRSPSREGYRKSGGGGGGMMPPPRSPARSSAPRSRVSRPPRRSFRGRSLRMRGTYRGSLRSRGTFTRRFPERSSYTRVFKSVRSNKGHSSIKSKGESASSTEEDWDAEEKEVDEKDAEPEIKKEHKIKSPKADKEDVGGDTEKEEKDAASDDEKSVTRRSRITGRPFIALSCVHCKAKVETFKAYSAHLVSLRHRNTMNVVARRLRMQLMRMRLTQRDAQRQIEEQSGEDLQNDAAFCIVCRLKYRTTRHAHNTTESHRAMKAFLMPYCRVCRITFRSPMVYEHHICDLPHIKRKAAVKARRPSPKADGGSGDEVMDVDLDNFMTLDSVGDVDEVDDEESGGEKKDETEPKKIKKEINVGSEHIKKMEVYWCELCRIYLPRSEPNSADERETLRRHCRLRVHLGRYVQHRDTRTLRKHAERIHRQLHQQKDGDKDESLLEDKSFKESKPESSAEKKKSFENGSTEEKLWADVDKDIGDLLREVDPQGNDVSDDEDEGRYDRFRKSDTKLKGTDEDIDLDAKDTSISELEVTA